jgi:hypothetical protein
MGFNLNDLFGGPAESLPTPPYDINGYIGSLPSMPPGMMAPIQAQPDPQQLLAQAPPPLQGGVDQLQPQPMPLPVPQMQQPPMPAPQFAPQPMPLAGGLLNSGGHDTQAYDQRHFGQGTGPNMTQSADNADQGIVAAKLEQIRREHGHKAAEEWARLNSQSQDHPINNFMSGAPTPPADTSIGNDNAQPSNFAKEFGTLAGFPGKPQTQLDRNAEIPSPEDQKVRQAQDAAKATDGRQFAQDTAAGKGGGLAAPGSRESAVTELLRQRYLDQQQQYDAAQHPPAPRHPFLSALAHAALQATPAIIGATSHNRYMMPAMNRVSQQNYNGMVDRAAQHKAHLDDLQKQLDDAYKQYDNQQKFDQTSYKNDAEITDKTAGRAETAREHDLQHGDRAATLAQTATHDTEAATHDHATELQAMNNQSQTATNQDREFQIKKGDLQARRDAGDISRAQYNLAVQNAQFDHTNKQAEQDQKANEFLITQAGKSAGNGDKTSAAVSKAQAASDLQRQKQQDREEQVVYGKKGEILGRKYVPKGQAPNEIQAQKEQDAKLANAANPPKNNGFFGMFGGGQPAKAETPKQQAHVSQGSAMAPDMMREIQHATSQNRPIGKGAASRASTGALKMYASLTGKAKEDAAVQFKQAYGVFPWEE